MWEYAPNIADDEGGDPTPPDFKKWRRKRWSRLLQDQQDQENEQQGKF